MDDTAAVDLYALPPEQFTAARDEQAGRDKTVKALRRPTVSAWIVNTLMRADPAAVDELAALGAELAAAQTGRDPTALRTLSVRRREQVEAVADAAITLAGREVSPAARAEVVGTLDAAVADQASAEAVRSGRLVRALSYAGFGGVDLDGAVAPQGSGGTARDSGNRRTPTVAAGQPQPAAPRPVPGKAAARVPAATRPALERSTLKRNASERRAHERQALERQAMERRANEGQALERQALEAAGALDDAVRTCAQTAATSRDAGETAGRAEASLAHNRAAVDAAQRSLAEAREAYERAEVALARATEDVEQASARDAAAKAALEHRQGEAAVARDALDAARRS